MGILLEINMVKEVSTIVTKHFPFRQRDSQGYSEISGDFIIKRILIPLLLSPLFTD
jgi:hypothetical protein